MQCAASKRAGNLLEGEFLEFEQPVPFEGPAPSSIMKSSDRAGP